MADPVLETERLILRRIEEADAALHYDLLNSPKAMEHLGGPRELHEIEAKHATAMASFARYGFGFMMLIEKSSGEMVGHAGMKQVENPLAPNVGDHEVGWMIREDRWRMGYAYEAMRAVVDWAFTCFAVPHLVALTSHSNKPSWRLMEKLGMVRAEELDFEDPSFSAQHNPTIQYKITRTQWERAQ